MAGIFVSIALDGARGCGPTAKLTLLALADRANTKDGGSTWPSLADIAERTDRQVRQVRVDMRILEDRGWIRAEGSRHGGRGRATVYRLNLEAMLRAMSPGKAAAYILHLQGIPGALSPGFIEETRQQNAEFHSGNPAVSDTKAAVHDTKPGSPAHETRQCTAAELEVTGINRKELALDQQRVRVNGPRSMAEVLKIPLKKETRKAEPENLPNPCRSPMTEAEHSQWAKDQVAAAEANLRAKGLA